MTGLGVAARRTSLSEKMDDFSKPHFRVRRSFCLVQHDDDNVSYHRATATTAVDVALNVLGGVREGTGPVETLRKSPPSVLRKLCEKMGATYIKVRVAFAGVGPMLNRRCPRFACPLFLSVASVDTADIRARSCNTSQHMLWKTGLIFSIVLCPVSLFCYLAPLPAADPDPSCWCPLSPVPYGIPQVGQFIASSPTLFPADYVKEFQKCLDKTDSIPWSES